MKTIAVIDVGTNSAKITAVEVHSSSNLRTVLDASEITRLGEGVDKAKNLDRTAMERTAAVVEQFVRQAKDLNASEIRIVGTSALRDAANRQDFIGLVYDKTNITVEVIDGDREAALAFAAVRADPEVSRALHGPLLVFDIGGGSTELIIGEGIVPDKKVSLNIGAVRLTERYIKSDPPTQDEIDEATRAAQAEVLKANWIGRPGIAAGIGGTIVTLAAVANARDYDDVEALHGMSLTLAEIEEALSRFTAVPLVQRRAIVGLNPKRADVIICGTLILKALLIKCGLDIVTVSTRGLRYGLLAEMAQ